MSLRSWCLLIVVLVLPVGGATTALAAISTEKIVDAIGDAGDEFGTSVALDGSYAIVGAPGDATAGADAGKAVIYFDGGSGFVEQASLYPTSSPGSARFGASVAISGSYAVVGAPYLAGGVGAGLAYVYERTGSTWSLHAILAGPGTSLDDRFGAAVSIDGVHVLVGAPGYDSVLADTGAVFAFERSGASWGFVNRVDNPHPFFQQAFGRAIDVDLPWTVVGSLPRGSNLGWVYVLDLPAGAWAFHSNFRPAGSSPTDDLGASVAVSGNEAMASAPGHSAGTNLAQGIAAAFELILGSWVQTGEFVEIPGDTTSMAVGLDGDLAVLSKDGSFGALPPGVVIAKRRTTTGGWVQVAGFQPLLGPTLLEGFGSSLSVSGDCALAGAPKDSENGSDAGAVWAICVIPQLLAQVDLDIICCERIPDYTTGPVEFEIRWENVTALSTSVQRAVRLTRPDGSQVDLVDVEQVDLDPGTRLVEPFEIDLTPYVEGAGAEADGDYALVLAWTDAEGTELEEIEFFSVGLAPAVPLLPSTAALLLACALGVSALRRMRVDGRA